MLSDIFQKPSILRFMSSKIVMHFKKLKYFLLGTFILSFCCEGVFKIFHFKENVLNIFLVLVLPVLIYSIVYWIFIHKKLKRKQLDEV